MEDPRIKEIETELNENNFEFEIGRDNKQNIYIKCAASDEDLILETINNMNSSKQEFICFGSFSSDAI